MQIVEDCRRRAEDAGAIAKVAHDINIANIFRNIAKAWLGLAEMIERNGFDEVDAAEIRSHIERAEERVLGSRLAIAEANELIATADKLISRR
jgi:hypothetical protein